MRALVFEQWQGGHYFNYLECLVPRLAELCDEVVVAVTQPASTATQLAGLRQLPKVRFDAGVPVPSAAGPLAFRMQLGRNLIEAIERNRPDYVLLPSADEQLIALPLLARWGGRHKRLGMPIEAVIHYRAYTSCDGFYARTRSAIQRQLLSTGVFNRLNFVNYLQYEDAANRRLAFAGMARAAGDPVPAAPRIERTLARQRLGLEADGRYVGMVGGLDARKAVPATLAAFRAASLRHSDRLLLAGRLEPGYRKLIQDDYADLIRGGRLIVLDRFLDNDEIHCAFAALDLHCSVYNSFPGLSSLMLKSLAAGVPVLVNEGGWGAATAKRFAAGWAVQAQPVAGFARSLRAALDGSSEFAGTPALERLLRFHSIANFTEGLLERVAELAGRYSGPVLPWSWVLEALPPERRQLR